MFGKFEDAEDAQDADEDERAAAAGALAVTLGLLHGQNDEVRHDRQQVEQVHRVLGELQLRRTAGDSQQELDGKPRHADGLDQEERVAVVGPLVVGPAAVGTHVEAERAVERRQGLGAEVGDGDEDTHDRHHGEDAS